MYRGYDCTIGNSLFGVVWVLYGREGLGLKAGDYTVTVSIQGKPSCSKEENFTVSTGPDCTIERLYILHDGTKYYDGETIELACKSAYLFELKNLKPNDNANWAYYLSPRENFSVTMNGSNLVVKVVKGLIKSGATIEASSAQDPTKKVKLNLKVMKIDLTDFNITCENEDKGRCKYILNDNGATTIRLAFTHAENIDDIDCLKRLVEDWVIGFQALPGSNITIGQFNVIDGKTVKVIVSIDKLPNSNAGFGEKRITVSSSAAQKTVDVTLFFDKVGRGNPTDNPNWFYYWKEGGVCGIPHKTIYDQRASFGYVRPGVDDILRLGPDAPTENTGPEYFFASEEEYGDSVNSLYGPVNATGTGIGIACVAETVAHELFHLTIYNNSKGLDDLDGDGVADVHEENGFYWGIKSDPKNPDTRQMAEYYSPGYASYGDNEILCRVKELNHTIITIPSLDWSKGGQQW